MRVRLLSDGAFGRRDTEVLHEVHTEGLLPGYDIGKSLVGQDEPGNAISFRITAFEKGMVKLDVNHPLPVKR